MKPCPKPSAWLHPTPALVKLRNGDTNAAPFQDRHNFEMYAQAAYFTTACVHHQATGQTNLLAIAIKAADFLYRTFNESSPEAARSSVVRHTTWGSLISTARPATPVILNSQRSSSSPAPRSPTAAATTKTGFPFEQQTTAMGPRVRANYLYAGAVDLFMETGPQSLESTRTHLAQSHRAENVYHGRLRRGCSTGHRLRLERKTSRASGGRPTPGLPNTTAQAETCANIGNVLWNWRMFLVTGEARFVDVAELASTTACSPA